MSADSNRSSGGERPRDDGIDEHVRFARGVWPQIEPLVEGIVTRIGAADRHLGAAMRGSLASAGLTKEEFKVLMALLRGARSHGSLSRQLMVSTGAMTNRLDKLERAGLVRRSPDPKDRRGVLLDLTPEGKARLDEYIDTGAAREQKLLSHLSEAEKEQLNRLLQRLLLSIQAELER